MRVGKNVALTVVVTVAAAAALAVGSRDDDARAVRALAMTTATTPAPAAARDLDEPAAVPTAPVASGSGPSPSASAPASTAPAAVESAQLPAAAARALPVAASSAPPAPPATPAPAACPPDQFCYPRLGIAGPIVPYTDCSGQANVGTQIRSFSCLSDDYLMGHAYTSFGRIADWQAGDVVIARGVTYHVRGAFQQAGCTQPVLPLAPLTMQTSLTSNPCGPVLIVQAG
ncbi:MAG: hypothetical protein KGJ98_11340 [Chloroflexota bacterium]|nr:hypothetical protein [Chloroflexota bacterium]